MRLPWRRPAPPPPEPPRGVLVLCRGKARGGQPCRLEAGASGYCPFHEPKE